MHNTDMLAYHLLGGFVVIEMRISEMKLETFHSHWLFSVVAVFSLLLPGFFLFVQFSKSVSVSQWNNEFVFHIFT